MNLTPHFTLEEFTASDTASRRGIDNTLPVDLVEVVRSTALMMERIRAYLGQLAGHDVSLPISSGYRCAALNRAIGSVDSSDHPKAMAVDFKAPSFGTPFDVASALAPKVSEFGIGQLIYEHTWVHVSTRTPAQPGNRILTLRGTGYIPGIVQ